MLNFSIKTSFVALIALLCGTYADVVTVAVSKGRVSRGDDVTITCTVDRTITASASIVWLKRQGSVTLTIANDEYVVPDLEDNSRYSLSLAQGPRYDSYTLSINNVKYEDSGTYECQLRYQGAGASERGVLAVCENSGSDSCKCQHSEGWADPKCFEEPRDAAKTIEQYEGAVIGLVICLVIVIVYAVVVTVYLYRDVIRTLKLRAEKRLEQRRRQASRSAQDDTHTLDLTDNASMISSSHIGHVTRSHDQYERDYARLGATTNGYSPRGHGGDERDYARIGATSNGYSPRSHGNSRPQGVINQGFHEEPSAPPIHRVLDSSTSLPRYDQLPPGAQSPVATGHKPQYPSNYAPAQPHGPSGAHASAQPQGPSGAGSHPDYPVPRQPPSGAHGYAQHPDSAASTTASPSYRNPPPSGNYSSPADRHDRSGSQGQYSSSQGQGNASSPRNGAENSQMRPQGYQGVRPKNSPPGQSAFSPVQKDMKPASNGTGQSPNNTLHNASMNDSTMATPTTYVPPQYATYEGGLHQAGGGASTPRDAVATNHSAPHSARSERQPASDRMYSERGAYTEQSKPPRQNGYAHDMRNHHGQNEQRNPHHVAPKRLDFHPGQTGSVYNASQHGGQYVSNHDTVI